MRGQDGTLIATIGTKPQVVTTAVDLLLREGCHLSEVIVVHHATAGGPVAGAIERLQTEFELFPAYQAIHFTLSPISSPAGPLTDIESEADAEDAFRGLYRLLLEVKRAEPTRPVHLSITGGRKVLAVYGMAAAQLLFDEEDTVWYVLAGGRFLAEERLHPGPEDEAKLVRVPVLRWGTISPILTDLSQVDDPFAAVKLQGERRVREALSEARFFLESLTEAERRVVALLVQEGLSDSQIAERLTVSSSTIGTHLEHVYRKARVHWGLSELNRSQLIGLLSTYFTLVA